MSEIPMILWLSLLSILWNRRVKSMRKNLDFLWDLLMVIVSRMIVEKRIILLVMHYGVDSFSMSLLRVLVRIC